MMTPMRLLLNLSGCSIMAATGTADDGSITIFIRSQIILIAAIIDSSETVRIPSQLCEIME
jgi:hypothetical protein